MMIINRHHIRIKVMQNLYSLSINNDNSKNVEKYMIDSMKDMNQIYCLLLNFITSIKNIAIENINLAKKKNFPTDEDKNPNLKFINNSVIKIIKTNRINYDNYYSSKINWADNDEFVVLLYKIMLKSDIYSCYINNGATSFEEDKDFVLNLFNQYIVKNEKIINFFEDNFIFASSDLPIIANIISNVIDRLSYKNRVILNIDTFYHIDFMKKLYRMTIENSSYYEDIIKKVAIGWDLTRMVSVDLILMKMALTELYNIPDIPKKVSLNEYIKISKEYSTPKSKIFINGILDKIFQDNKKELKK